MFTDNWVYPEKKVTMSIYRGYGCKLVNSYEEKFWVTFIKEEKGFYLGMVNNHLFKGSQYNLGDLVVFKKNHIWDIMTPERRKREASKVKKIMNDFYAIHKRTPTMLEIIKIEEEDEIGIEK